MRSCCPARWKSNGVETPVFESAITHLRRKFRTPEIANGTTYVATMGNRIVAFVLFNGNEIADLFVAPAVQGQGIGKQLLDFAKPAPRWPLADDTRPERQGAPFL